MRLRWLFGLALAIVLVSLAPAAPAAHGVPCDLEREYLVTPGFRVVDNCLVPKWHRHFNFYRDTRPVNADGTLNIVNEIPAGTNAKWEVSEETGQMCWELKNGKPRIIKYLGYSTNYGMVPRTMGGDGDSLDVLTIGELRFRGEIVRVKLIGVMHMLDGDEVDDKLIAVIPGTPAGDFNSLDELEAAWGGTKSIIKTWFESYKGPGEIEVTSFGGPEDARAVLNAGLAAYQ
jgi:inorganic pyrophosphatase